MGRRLIPLSAFAEVFEPFKGKTVTLTQGTTYNPADVILHTASEQLLTYFGVKFIRDITPEVSSVFLFAGGSMGGPFKEECRIRYDILNRARQHDLPVVLLPQSFYAPRPRNVATIDVIYAREDTSVSWAEGSRLAPDLALGLQYPECPAPVEVEGHVLRGDRDGEFCQRYKQLKVKDPVLANNLPHYLRLASRYERLFTDRAHLAIAALGFGRKVTLLPNSYHKNRSLYDTWLRDLGCEWMERQQYEKKYRSSVLLK